MDVTKENRKISIIIPVYNVETYLDKCISSVINQSYQNTEIILVDDGSTDSSGKMCDEWKKKDTRVIVIHKENGGLSSARNAGIDIATGDYIGFVDSDDYIDRAMYKVLVKKMEEYNADISICNRYYTYEDNTTRIRYRLTENDLIMNSEDAILEMNSFRTFDMAVWDKLYKKKIFNEIRFPVGRLSEDFFIMYRVFDLAERVCYSSQPLYYYMQRKGSISRGKKINYDFLEAAREQMEFVQKKYPNLKNCMHCAYASANTTVYNFHIKNRVKCEKKTRKNLQSNVKKNICYVKDNKNLSFVKKLQLILFTKSICLYNVTFKIFKIFNKI